MTKLLIDLSTMTLYNSHKCAYLTFKEEYPMISLLGKYISILHRQEQKSLNVSLKQYGLGYSSYNFLLYISKNEGSSQKDICQTLAINEALATRTMKKLEQKGYIIRKKEENDQRSYALYLTEHGREIIPKLIDAVYQWWEELTSDFDENQSSLLIAQLEQMTEKSLEIAQHHSLQF